MPEKVLFLKSQLKEKIYGGNRIATYFGFDDQLDKKIGEFWAISAHPNGPSKVIGGEMDGTTLNKVWDMHRDIFGNAEGDRFPLLIKVNEITSPVSVQVHPNDAYAKKYANDLGKAEFCLFLDVQPGTKIIRGHRAKTKEEFKAMVEAQDWKHLFIRKDVKTNDFVFTPAGIIHGVEGKMLMAEVQQSSNVTYRIYDYDNRDVDGNPRELHITNAIEVTEIPYKEPIIDVKTIEADDCDTTIYCDNEYFRVKVINNKTVSNYANENYTLITILSGQGKAIIDGNEYNVKQGMNMIITAYAEKYSFLGKMKILITQPPRKD